MSNVKDIPPVPDALRGNTFDAGNPGALVDPSQVPDWEMKLAALAKETLASERPPGQFFSTKGGQLSFNRIPLNNNEMNVVITAAMFENVYYTEKFSADKISAPTCYAFAIGTDENMAPHRLAHAPQHGDCANCPQNKWGSDPGGGKGKACKNMRRLAVIPASNADDPETVKKATTGFIRVPVTSTKEWAAYVRTLAQAGRTPLTVITNIKLVPDAKTMHKFLFTFVKDVSDRDCMKALVERHEFDVLDITTPYPAKDDGQQAATPAAQPAAAPAGAGKFG